MKKIVIIGAGQIGSRHLQAMANLEGNVRIHLVDLSEESLRIAQKRFFQVYKENSKRIELHCQRTIADLPETIDVAIVATCSDVRAGVIKEILERKVAKYLILEKVLFQEINEYFEIEGLLKKENVPTWINCWMREKVFYRNLKTQLDLSERVEMSVAGSRWLLGSSGIHFMDLFSFLTDCNDFHFTSCELDRELIESKRFGFKEFTGLLRGGNSKGHSLTLSRDNGDDPYKIIIENGCRQHEVTDCGSFVNHRFSDGKNQTIDDVEIPFQSQTTHHLVQQILATGNCSLPGYKISMNLHLPFIKVLIDHLQVISASKVEKCPIT